MSANIDSPRIAVRVVLYRDGKILLLKRIAGSNCGRWEVPGGVAEFLEGTMLALKREIREEIGFLITPAEQPRLLRLRMTTISRIFSNAPHLGGSKIAIALRT